MLSFLTKPSLKADAFLKEKGVLLHYDRAELEADQQTHDRLRANGKSPA
jgi:hypothetical protein